MDLEYNIYHQPSLYVVSAWVTTLEISTWGESFMAQIKRIAKICLLMNTKISQNHQKINLDDGQTKIGCTKLLNSIAYLKCLNRN